MTLRARFGILQAKPSSHFQVKIYSSESREMDGRFSLLDANREHALSKIDRNMVQENESVEPPAMWQFSAGPMMPEWPKQNTGFTPKYKELTTDTFEASSSNSGFPNDTWNLSEGAMWDVGVWEDWDLDLGDIKAPVPDFERSVSPTKNNSFSPFPLQQSQIAINSEDRNYAAPTARLSSNIRDTLNTSSAVAEQQRAKKQSYSSGRLLARRSDLLIRTPGQASDTRPNTLALGPMQQLQVYSGPSNSSLRSPMVSQSTALPKSPDLFATGSLASSRQSNDQTSPHRQLKDKRYHKDTERRYRLRLNEKFTALLNALPDDLVESASGLSGRSQADKALSKIDILALAKSHIASLEKEQSELEEESLVLKGQQQLFKRLFRALDGS